MPELALIDIAEYQTDAEASLQFYFSGLNPSYNVRFFDYFQAEVADELLERLDETDMRSALVIAARMEAAFRIDFKLRVKKKGADPISIAFRKIYKKKGLYVRLDEDILQIWRTNMDDPTAKELISQLRGVFHFRHWLAHGRYWQIGNKYKFQDIYLLADTILQNFPLLG